MRASTTGRRRPGEKDAWVSEVLRDWGSCGRVVLVEDQPVGYLIYAPAAFVPGAAAFPTAPVSPDAVLLTTAYVVPEHARRRAGPDAGAGHGARPDPPGRHPGGGGVRGQPRHRAGAWCPADFLGGVGFKTHRPHPVHPRMRMELRSALTWRDELEAAVERLLGAVRPAPKSPNPARHTPRRVQ